MKHDPELKGSDMIDTEAKQALAIKQVRQAARNLYRACLNRQGREFQQSWKAARVLNSLSNSLEFGMGLYEHQLTTFLADYHDADA